METCVAPPSTSGRMSLAWARSVLHIRRKPCPSLPPAHDRAGNGSRRRPFLVPEVRGQRAVVGAQQSDEVYYQGVYGPWKVDQQDLVEVWSYRVGLSVAATAYVSVGLYGLLPEQLDGLEGSLDAITLVGCVGMAASLALIHIYVTPLKRALQVLCGLGTLGFLYIAATQDQPAAVFVAQHPVYMWLVGPLFAAITGVAFKEGFCYNKWEAAGLFGAMPLLMGGHLLGIWSQEAERGLLASTLVLISVFAARKYTQAVKDDIGDKSVFTFLGMSPGEQQELLANLRQ